MKKTIIGILMILSTVFAFSVAHACGDCDCDKCDCGQKCECPKK